MAPGPVANTATPGTHLGNWELENGTANGIALC
jgi:hypothetical protein